MGRKAAIEISASDPNGVRDLRLVQLLVNNDLNGVEACYLNFDVADNRIWLIADDGSSSAGVGRPGEQATLANAQCAVRLGQASTRTEGNGVMIRISIEFNASFTGPRRFHTYAIDRTGLRTEWRARAVWQVN